MDTNCQPAEQPSPSATRSSSSDNLPLFPLLFTAACLIPAVVVAVSSAWKGRETQAHGLLLTGLRLVALGFGYLVVGLVCVPVLGLHYVDKF